MCQAHAFSQVTLLLSALGQGKGNRLPKSTAAEQQSGTEMQLCTTPRPTTVLDCKHVV